MDDMYPDTFGTEHNPFGYEEIISRMDRLDAEMRKVCKKKKGNKKGGKKKLKKQIKKLQREQEQLRFFLSFVMIQQQQQGKKKKKKQKPEPVRWQEVLANSMPIVLSNLSNNLTKPKPQFLPENNQLYLTGQGKK